MIEATWQEWLNFFAATDPGGISKDRKHLLVIDLCKVHMSEAIATKALELGFAIVLLPAHTSHMLQPLDIGCFHSAKAAFRRHELEYLFEFGKTKIKRQQMAKMASWGVAEGLTPENIRAGFKAAGIWAIDKTAMDQHYKPSMPYHRPARAPAGVQDVPAAGEGGGEGGVTEGEEVGEGVTGAQQDGQAGDAQQEGQAADDQFFHEQDHWAWLDGQPQHDDLPMDAEQTYSSMLDADHAPNDDMAKEDGGQQAWTGAAADHPATTRAAADRQHFRQLPLFIKTQLQQTRSCNLHTAANACVRYLRFQFPAARIRKKRAKWCMGTVES